tara:strand:- start:507 stop:1112 length:606 start_codon:yes stop_codon:yes gene_type:complete
MGRFTKILRNKGIKNLSSNREVHQQVYKKSKEIFETSKRKMLEDFKRHPVTKEIEGGPEASNTSNTIIGQGNLYSFIGFQDGANPIRPVYHMLHLGTKLISRNPRVIKKTKDKVYLGFRVSVPSEKSLASVSRMPWEPGSWLFRIERGISGLGYYIYEKYIKASRSGTGIQADGKVRHSTFKRTSYISAILKTFKKNFVVK